MHHPRIDRHDLRPEKSRLFRSFRSPEPDALPVRPHARKMLSAFELERQARIEDNKRRMSEMGINTLATKLDAVAAPVPNPKVRPRL